MTHADDLAKILASLAAGPVHVVGRAYGAAVAATAAVKDPSMVRTLTLHEPSLFSVLSAESEEGRAAREDQRRVVAPAIATQKTGDSIQAARLCFESMYRLEPGGFDHLPQATQTLILDNARTTPLIFGAPRPPAVTCDALKAFNRPILVTYGEKAHLYFKLIIEGNARMRTGRPAGGLSESRSRRAESRSGGVHSGPHRVLVEALRAAAGTQVAGAPPCKSKLGHLASVIVWKDRSWH